MSKYTPKYIKPGGFIQADALALAGLLAISIVLMQGLLPLGLVDIPVAVALIAFAIAIPLLAICIFIDRWTEIPPKAKSYNFSYVTGLLVAPVGIVAAFWHISWYIGVICLLSCLVASSTIFNVLYHLFYKGGWDMFHRRHDPELISQNPKASREDPKTRDQHQNT